MSFTSLCGAVTAAVAAPCNCSNFPRLWHAASAGGATGEGVHVATTATAGAAASVIDADADTAADVKINTFFRNQDNITTTDASSEKDIPGLEATDYKKVWRAIPNVGVL